MIPGSNLLRTAMRVISPNRFVWRKFVGNQKTPDGVLVPSYRNVPAYGSVQSVESKEIARLELDISEEYIRVYAPIRFNVGGRDASSDRIGWNGQDYQLLLNNDWATQDGWSTVLAIRLGKGK